MKIIQLFKKLFIKEKSDYKEYEEIRRSIAESIQNIRVKHLNHDLKLPLDQKALDEFYKLAIYCINNFPIPKSHIAYCSDRLNVDASASGNVIINDLFSHWSKTRINFDLEYPLRGVEVIFSFGKFKISEEQIEIINQHVNNLIFALDKRHYKAS